MIEKMLETLGKAYPLTQRDAGEYARQKISGMTFYIRCFQAEGLGPVSAMTASGFFGLMKMDTLIINPTERDMPLLSYDRVRAMGNDTLIVELYDTLLGETDLSALDAVKKKAEALPDHDLGEHWYDAIKLKQSLSKKGKKAHTGAFSAAAMSCLSAYLDAAGAAAPCEGSAKREKASVYVGGF